MMADAQFTHLHFHYQISLVACRGYGAVPNRPTNSLFARVPVIKWIYKMTGLDSIATRQGCGPFSNHRKSSCRLDYSCAHNSFVQFLVLENVDQLNRAPIWCTRV